MKAFSLNNKASFAIGALIVLSILFALSRMPGGIGGTGIDGGPGGIGGTGIYGRIDAFGSIWVNGVEIFYDEKQNVVRQGRDGLPDRLAIGQFVAVTIDETTGIAEAKSIEIVEEVNGQIEHFAPDQFIVLGQTVLLTDETIIEGDLQDGRQVAVNGLRSKDGLIIASRIAAPLVEGELALRGTVERVEGESFWVGDQEILLEGKNVNVGYEVELRGKMDNTRADRPVFVSEAFETDLNTLFDDTVVVRKYQKIVEGNTSIDFNGYDISQTKINDYNIATMDVEFQKNESDLTQKNEKIREFTPLVREQRIEARISAQRTGNERVMENQQSPNVETAGEKNIPLVKRKLNEIVEERPNKQEPVAPPPREAQVRQSIASGTELDERIKSRRIELQKSRLAGANIKRLAAVEARRQAIEQARSQTQNQTQPQSIPNDSFEPRELEEMLQEGNIDRGTYQQIQRTIRDRVAQDIRQGARYEARDEVRRRVREEIRRRIRRQLRAQ